MERVKGIEPSYSAWKAAALPLSYTRLMEVLMPALAASGKMECCVSELVCRLEPKVVDSRNKSGHDSVGGIWVVGLGTLFGGVGLEAWVWGFCMGRSRVKAASPSKRADSSKAVMTALVAVIHDLFSVLKKVNYSPLQSATARPS